MQLDAVLFLGDYIYESGGRRRYLGVCRWIRNWSVTWLDFARAGLYRMEATLQQARGTLDHRLG